MTNRPFIHLFQTYGQKYVYDVNTNVILKVPDNVYQFLIENKNDFEKLQANPVLNIMIKDGFFDSNPIEEIIHPSDEVISYMANNSLKMLTMQVTQRCNLDCKYCTYSDDYLNRDHSQKEMDFETAKKSIDFLIQHSKDTREIHFGFYGGEPLLNFELIKECVDYIKEVGVGKEISFGMTTNGTLLTEKVVKYLKKHNFSILISLDGPEEIHNENRVFKKNCQGSFDIIMERLNQVQQDFPEFFARNIRFNAVIDPLLDFSCTNTFFANYETVKDANVQFSFISNNYRKDKVDYSNEQLSLFNYEIFKLFLSRLGRLSEDKVSKLVQNYYLSTKSKYHEERTAGRRLPPKVHHSGPCIPGVLRLFVNAEGEFFPCERVSENSEVTKIGHVDSGFDMDKVKEVLNIGKLTEDKCKNCWAIRFCTLCVAAADNLTSLSSDKKRSKCGEVKATIQRGLQEYCTLREFGHNFA